MYTYLRLILSVPAVTCSWTVTRPPASGIDTIIPVICSSLDPTTHFLPRQNPASIPPTTARQGHTNCTVEVSVCTMLYMYSVISIEVCRYITNNSYYVCRMKFQQYTSTVLQYSSSACDRTLLNLSLAGLILIVITLQCM